MTKEQNHDAFGVILRSHRLEKGFTQEQLSEMVGVVHSFICSLESGRKQPSLQMILKLSAALGIRPGDMINEMADRIVDK